MKVIVTTVVEEPTKPRRKKVVEIPQESLWETPMVFTDEDPPKCWDSSLPINELCKLRQRKKTKH